VCARVRTKESDLASRLSTMPDIAFPLVQAACFPPRKPSSTPVCSPRLHTALPSRATFPSSTWRLPAHACASPLLDVPLHPSLTPTHAHAPAPRSVNCASRMESTGFPGSVQVSADTYQAALSQMKMLDAEEMAPAAEASSGTPSVSRSSTAKR